MIDLFYKIFRSQPALCALEINGVSLTYQALWQQACANAKLLQQQGVQPGQIIALHLHKSTEFVVMQLACWLAGVAFMPLPPEWPMNRKQQVLAYSEAVAIVANNKQNSLKKCKLPQWAVSKKHLDNFVFNIPRPEDLAYVIFTSGSSGEPKGVLISFAGLPHIITQQINLTQVTSGQRCLWLHHQGFDASIADIWVALLAGATLVADNDLKPANILQFISAQNINYVDLPAALLPIIDINCAPKYLHTLLMGGEVCDLEALRRWAQIKRVVLAYGPSETTICSSMYLVNGNETQANWIGQPLEQLQYWVVDDQLKPVPLGQVGELLITGPGVALGYLNGNENNTRFLQFQGLRGYRTGDRVCQTEQSYQFLGRIDRQFKLHGKLICPEEIEQVLLGYKNIIEAYVFKHNQQLVAAIVPEISTDKLQEWIFGRLPSWMCPQQWLCLAALPRNQNQKVNQTSLIAEHKQRLTMLSDDPVLSLIQQVLQQPSIGLDDDLTEWAPQSFQWLELLVELKQLGIKLSYEQLLTIGPIRKLSEALQKHAHNEDSLTHNIGIDSSRLKLALQYYLPITPSKNLVQHQGILLTGATGNLGAELLILLSQCKRPVYCLVRGDERRLQACCHKQGLNINWNRVVVLNGDITQPYFALTQSQWQLLTEQVSDIYHCAADTSLLKSWEQLQTTNVTGSYHVLKLMEEGQQKHLHYASTLSLVVDSSWQSQQVNESNPLSTGEFYGGYTQSKWQAEQLIRQSVSANIFRFGLLTGMAKRSPLPVSDWFNSRLLLKPDFSHLPTQSSIDFTPIHYAAKLMIGISQKCTEGTYHIYNPKPVLAKELAAVINQHKLNKNLINNTMVWQSEKPTDPLRLFKMTNTQITSDTASYYAQALGLSFPMVDNDYLSVYLESLWQ